MVDFLLPYLLDDISPKMKGLSSKGGNVTTQLCLSWEDCVGVPSGATYNWNES